MMIIAVHTELGRDRFFPGNIYYMHIVPYIYLKKKNVITQPIRKYYKQIPHMIYAPNMRLSKTTIFCKDFSTKSRILGYFVILMQYFCRYRLFGTVIPITILSLN